MENFTREQITKVIEDCEKIADDNLKHCAATATSEALERIREYFKPLNNKIETSQDPCKCHKFYKNQNSYIFCPNCGRNLCLQSHDINT